jgi:hypothetical protein
MKRLAHLGPLAAGATAIGALILLLPLTAVPQTKQARALAEEVRALRGEVKALKARVATLEATRPPLTNFMPDFSERFHVMHLAGDVGDWGVAQHELLEMKRMLGVAKAIDPQKGQLMEGFLAGSFHEVTAALEHGNPAKFRKALEQMVASCNKCHTAAGSPFIQVSLDVDKSLSMRHPHALKKSKVMGANAHKH